MRSMRPYGTSEQLAKRRSKAIKLLRRGKTTREVSQWMGVTERCVRYWRESATQPEKKKRSKAPGRPSQLSAKQLARLEKELHKGAYAHGYAEDYWTLDRIGRLIWDKFAVRYHPSAVWHLMKRMGWSCQRPQRRSLARNEEAIRRWKRYVWPRVKKVA
jgi:transposase